MSHQLMTFVFSILVFTSNAFAENKYNCTDKNPSGLTFNVTIFDYSAVPESIFVSSTYEGRIVVSDFFSLTPCTVSAGGSGSRYGDKLFSSKYLIDPNSKPNTSCVFVFNYDRATRNGVIESLINGKLQTHYDVSCTEF